jgi:hypothetical protein
MEKDHSKQSADIFFKRLPSASGKQSSCAIPATILQLIIGKLEQLDIHESNAIVLPENLCSDDNYETVFEAIQHFSTQLHSLSKFTRKNSAIIAETLIRLYNVNLILPVSLFSIDIINVFFFRGRFLHCRVSAEVRSNHQR